MSFSKTYFGKGPFWEEKNTLPFNELILSWNGIRPKTGKWTFSVFLENEWRKAAEWGADGQRSFAGDTLFTKTLCTSFAIRVDGPEIPLAVCVSHLEKHAISLPYNLPPVLLKNVPRKSQMQLSHPRHKDLCSPTATTTAMQILTGKIFDPVQFAQNVRDEGFDIYGNWVFNVAESYSQTKCPCFVERLSDFTKVHEKLMQGLPVVVSIKGPIAGGATPYAQGHLICIVGYEAGKVICVDSAFPNDASTLVSYEMNDFLAAWGRRYNLAYVFFRKPLHLEEVSHKTADCHH